MDIVTHEKYRIVRKYNKSLENENHLPLRDLHIASEASARRQMCNEQFYDVKSFQIDTAFRITNGQPIPTRSYFRKSERLMSSRFLSNLVIVESATSVTSFTSFHDVINIFIIAEMQKSLSDLEDSK